MNVPLAYSGFQNVHGMDYSPSVIKNMQERSKDLKLSHIRYFQVCQLRLARTIHDTTHWTASFNPYYVGRCQVHACCCDGHV